jgi:lambda family phage portal protein
MKKGNLIDRAIAVFSPDAGLNRMRFRERLRHYESAAFGRRTKMFNKATSTGSNIEVGRALVTLRNRSRDLVRNNSWASRAITVISNNVIGEGIRPAPQGKKNQVSKAKELWKSWGESTKCDFYGKNTIYGLQSLAVKSMTEGGDFIIIKRRRVPIPSNPFSIQIQLLEGDHLDHLRDYQQFTNNSYCRLGVQFSVDGRIEGYWIYDNHPTDGINHTIELQSHFISIDDCIHVFELLRIGQIRGVPQGIASFIKIGDFSAYEDAQLLRQKMASMFTAFVSGHDFSTDDYKAALYDMLEPGTIQYLSVEETVTFGNPPPAEGYDAYTKKILQSIAASYNITYEQLTMDYSNVNFTSGRMAKIDGLPYLRNLQYNLVVPQMLVPVWGWFMDSCIMSGLMSSYVACESTDWTAPRIQMLNPVQETNALVTGMQAGIISLSEVHRESGGDLDEFIAECKSDMEKCKAAGLNFTSFAPSSR